MLLFFFSTTFYSFSGELAPFPSTHWVFIFFMSLVLLVCICLFMSFLYSLHDVSFMAISP